MFTPPIPNCISEPLLTVAAMGEKRKRKEKITEGGHQGGVVQDHREERKRKENGLDPDHRMTKGITVVQVNKR